MITEQGKLLNYVIEVIGLLTGLWQLRKPFKHKMFT